MVVVEGEAYEFVHKLRLIPTTPMFEQFTKEWIERYAEPVGHQKIEPKWIISIGGENWNLTGIKLLERGDIRLFISSLTFLIEW